MPDSSAMLTMAAVFPSWAEVNMTLRLPDLVLKYKIKYKIYIRWHVNFPADTVG